MRTEGWEIRLAAEIAKAQDYPWTWGLHDCATFAWHCQQAIADGPSAFDDFMNGWSDKESAQEALDSVGGFIEALDSRTQRVQRAYARRGDLALVNTPEGPALGIIDGTTIWCAAEHGLSTLVIGDALICWEAA